MTNQELCKRYAELDKELRKSVKSGDKEHFNKIEKEMRKIGIILWDRDPKGFYRFGQSGKSRDQLINYIKC